MIPGSVYADAILQELEAESRLFLGLPLASIYFGGGTPSRWEPEQVGRLIRAIRSCFSVAPVREEPEVTLEANPADVTVERLAAYAQAGINRVSLGLQSFQDDALRLLGRRHDARIARQALTAVYDSPIRRVTFDLICALPGQRLAAWDAELIEALSWQPTHLSVYLLSVEPETPLGRAIAAGDLVLPEEEEQLAMWRATRQRLGEAGLRQYEVSNHARPGHEARHNLLYWRGAPYLGLGAGAHSYLPAPDRRSGRRWANSMDPVQYLAAPGAVRGLDEVLGLRELAQERVLCRLRLAEGLDLELHRELGGEDLRVTRPAELTALVAAGLIELDERWLRLTAAGFEVADAIIGRLS